MEAKSTIFVYHYYILQVCRGGEAVDLELRMRWSKVRQTISHADVDMDSSTKRLWPRPPSDLFYRTAPQKNTRQFMESSLLFITELNRKSELTDFSVLLGQRGAEFQTSELVENFLPQINSLGWFWLLESLVSSCIHTFTLSFHVCSLCWGQYCSQENT